MKIGDLFVKLGLKKDEFSRGMKEAGNEGKSFADKMKAVGSAVKAAWAAVGAAIVKFATDAVKMTQRWGDTWEQTMAGIRGAYQAFVRQISSGEGWNNLFANMREAAKIARETKAALDELFERRVSLNYSSAQTEREIAAQTLIMRDTSKPEKEREAAARRIIELEEQLGRTKKDIAQQEADALRRQFQAQTGMNDAEIDFLVRRYNENRNAINQSRQYLQERKRLQQEMTAAASSYGTGAMSSAAYESIERRRKEAEKALQDLERNTSQYVKDLADLTKKYDKGNDELVKGMADADVAVIKVDTEVMQAQTRATALLGSLAKAKQMAGELGAGGGGEAANPLQIRANESMARELERQLAAMDNELENLPTIKYKPLEIVPPDLSAFDAMYDKMQERKASIIALNAELEQSLISGLSASVQAFTDQLAGLEDFNMGAVAQALLTPLADMAVREGEILIAQGIGIEACKKALESLNGWAAVAAGTALVAIGAAAKSGLAALARSGAGATATTSYASAGTGSAASQVQTIQTEMTVYVTGRLSGSDILLSGKKTQNNWNR